MAVTGTRLRNGIWNIERGTVLMQQCVTPSELADFDKGWKTIKNGIWRQARVNEAGSECKKSNTVNQVLAACHNCTGLSDYSRFRRRHYQPRNCKNFIRALKRDALKEKVRLDLDVAKALALRMRKGIVDRYFRVITATQLVEEVDIEHEAVMATQRTDICPKNGVRSRISHFEVSSSVSFEDDQEEDCMDLDDEDAEDDDVELASLYDTEFESTPQLDDYFKNRANRG